MIEMELLHQESIIGVTISLPKTKIILLYHTNAIVISEPFLLESKVFERMNVIYVSNAHSVNEMLDCKVEKFRLIQKVDIWAGMKVVDALEILQK